VEGIDVTIWTHELLDALRQIGDPALDPVDGKGGWRDVKVLPAEKGLEGEPEQKLLLTWRKSLTGAMPDAAVAYKDPFWTAVDASMDPDQLEIAYGLFAVYGGEIAASLLLASLPNAYAAEAGAAVLNTTQQLSSNTRRRIAETAQMVVDVMFPDTTRLYSPAALKEVPNVPSLLPGGRGYVRARSTRLTHAIIREVITSKSPWDPMATARVPARPQTLRGIAINQEDLLGTLGTFTVTTFEAMEKLGVPWNDEAEAAYLAHWGRVGELLGIGTSEVTDNLLAQGFDLPPEYHGALRPKTPEDARGLQRMIRERCWPVPLRDRVLGPFTNRNGKILARALLDELQAGMPRGMERLPQVVMRYLVHDTAHELLGLGGGGVPDSILRWPTQKSFVRTPGRRPGKVAIERTMRLAASEVSRRAFLYFIRSRAADDGQANFWFPIAPEERMVILEGRGSP
jgi:hypothetical protein